LRTLCLATRTISPEEYESWSKIFDEASTTLNNREEEVMFINFYNNLYIKAILYHDIILIIIF